MTDVNKQATQAKTRRETYGEAIKRSHKAGAIGLFRSALIMGFCGGLVTYAGSSLLQGDDGTVPAHQTTHITNTYGEKIEALRVLRQNKAEEIYRLQKNSEAGNPFASGYSDREQDIAAMLKVENAQNKILVQLFNEARLSEATVADIMMQTAKAGDLGKKSGLAGIIIADRKDIVQLRECQGVEADHLSQDDITTRAEVIGACIKGSNQMHLTRTLSGGLLGYLLVSFGAPALRRRKVTVEEPVAIPVKTKKRLEF